MRNVPQLGLALLLVAHTAAAQGTDSLPRGDKTFLTRRDLLTAGIAIGATALVSIWDTDIAQASQKGQYNEKRVLDFSSGVSKVNETTLTIGGIVVYGVGRLTHSATVADVALHATESVVLASLASQLIRGPLGRSRPYVTNDTNQFDFSAGKGFSNFANRAFPSIHTSSSMAVATVISMEVQRRSPGATPFVAPVLFAAGILPGLARIQLDQHWATDVFAGAFMGVFAGYKVVSYSHAHPHNWFDRVLNTASVAPQSNGQVLVMLSPTF
ncbi:MAG: phosphoesterase PA-phosphatase related protein [Gemmatimonadetes bacterium]|nr:phosphoesterase PA-phosphatase related protein [Gemmatimonadota bacterium]